MVDSTAGEGNWSQPRVRAPHCARQPRLTQPATTNRSEIPLISEHQADAGRIREPGRLADDVPTQFAFDSAAAAEQVLGADAEVDSTASLGIRVGCILEELTHEVRASPCGHKRQEVFVLEVVHAVEQQLHLAEVILGEVLEAGARPAKQPSDAEGRRRVVLAERTDRDRLLELLVRKKDSEF